MTNIYPSVLIITLLLLPSALALSGSMALSSNPKYVNCGKITVDTSSSYNLEQPLIWNPLTFSNSYPPGIQGQSSYTVILSLVDLKMVASSSRIQFTQATSSNRTSFTVQIYSNLANYIQRMSYRYLILSGSYVSASNLVALRLTWSYNANLVQVASPSPAYYNLATALNNTGTIASYCFLTGMDAKSTTLQNILSFAVTADASSSSYVSFYLTSTSTVPTYITSINFDFLAFNVGYYNRDKFANFYYRNFQTITGSYGFPGSNLINNNNTVIGLNGFSVLDDNFVEFSLSINVNEIGISSNKPDNYKKSYQVNYVTMLTYYCTESTPFLNLLISVCYDVCPVRTFSDSLTLSCTACPYDCYTCDNIGCLTCNTVTDFRIFNSSSSKCVPLDGYYDNLTTVCVKCAQNCLKCINASNCLNCVTGSYLSGGICKGCMVGCSACISSSQCQYCSQGFSLASSFFCYLSCNPGQYFNISTLSCQSCLKNCSICVSSTSCINCSSNHYYNYQIAACLKCPDGCATCLDGQICLSCKQAYFYNNSQCNPCPLNCQQCDNANTCKVCISDYTLNAAQCKVSQTASGGSSDMPIGIIVGLAIGGFIAALVFCVYRKCQKTQRRQSVIMKGDYSTGSTNQLKIEEPLSGRTNLDQWHTRAISVPANKDCSICLMEQSFFKTHCGHSFHLMCIVEWLSKRDNCPNCREPLSERKHKLYCRKCHSQYKVIKVGTLKEIVGSRRQEAETVCEDCRLVPI